MCISVTSPDKSKKHRRKSHALFLKVHMLAHNGRIHSRGRQNQEMMKNGLEYWRRIIADSDAKTFSGAGAGHI